MLNDWSHNGRRTSLSILKAVNVHFLERLLFDIFFPRIQPRPRMFLGSSSFGRGLSSPPTARTNLFSLVLPLGPFLGSLFMFFFLGNERNKGDIAPLSKETVRTAWFRIQQIGSNNIRIGQLRALALTLFFSNNVLTELNFLFFRTDAED